MLIFERSITLAEANFVRDYLNRRLRSGRFSEVGKTGVVHVFGNNNNIRSYAVLNNSQPVGWLKLGRKPGWAAFEVKHVWVEKEYRGTGLTERIYRAAINHDNIIIASGKTQTKWARALWARFVRDEIFNIWAHDLNNIDQFADVVYDEGEVYTPLQHLYTTDFSTAKKYDVRLVASRKHNEGSKHNRRLN